MQGAAQRAVGPRKGRYGLAARIAGGGGKERHEHEHEACRCARDAVLFSLGDLFLLPITCVWRLHWSVRRGAILRKE